MIFLEQYERIKRHLDEPLADSSLIVSWSLFAKIQEFGIRCVLSGDGADEVFGGYPTHFAHRFLPNSFRIPSMIAKRIQKLPSSSKGVSWDYMLKRFAQSQQPEWWKRHQLWNGAWFPWELKRRIIFGILLKITPRLRERIERGELYSSTSVSILQRAYSPRSIALLWRTQLRFGLRFLISIWSHSQPIFPSSTRSIDMEESSF